MIYTTKFISVLVFIALMLAACNKDEWKDDVDALKQPMPTGIVIMDAVSVTAVKGTSFQLRFRVNPLPEVPSLPSRGPLTSPRPTVIKSPEWNPTATVAARFSTASGL